jgi:hypothetical protein
MRQGHSGLHSKHLRVERTEAHRTRKKLDRLVRVASQGSQEPAEEPSRRKVWIEHERPVDQCDTAVEVTDEMRERVPGSGQGDCVVLAELDCAAGEASALSRSGDP